MIKRKFFTKFNLLLTTVFIFTLLVTATVVKIKKPINTEDSLAASSIPEEVLSDNTNTEDVASVTASITKAVQAISRTNSPTPTPVQNIRNLKVGIVVDDYKNKFGTITSLENQVGHKFTTVGIYKQFGLPTNRDLILSDISHIGGSGKTLMISWEPWNPQEGMGQSRDYLKEIALGNEDSYINKFISDIKTYNGKVILRFGHEMNGNWYPWGQRPEDYKAAFIKIHTMVKAQNASNISFNWSINSDNVPYEAISNVSKYYPGEIYVDTISIDGYNWGSTRPSQGWRSFTQIFIESYNYVSSAYNKPIIIAETGSTENGGKKDEWITQMFADVNTKFPQITEIVWFNLLKETDWRIESSASSLSAFERSLTNTP